MFHVFDTSSQFELLVIIICKLWADPWIFRGGCRPAATSKMERFVIIVNGLAATSKMERFVIIVNGLAVNCYHKAIHLRCCSSPRSDSDSNIFMNSTFNKRHPTSSCVRCNCIFAAFLQFLYVFLDLLFLCLSICSLNKLDQNSYSEDFGKPWLFFVAHVKL